MSPLFPALVLDPAQKRLSIWRSANADFAWTPLEEKGTRWSQTVAKAVGSASIMTLRSVVVGSDRSTFSDARAVTLLANLLAKELNLDLYQAAAGSLNTPADLIKELAGQPPQTQLKPNYFSEPNITKPNV